jgi:predicted alpha/beta-hydrolase family hydrolase
MRRLVVRAGAAIVLGLAIVAVVLWASGYARSASLVVRAAQLEGPLRVAARAQAHQVAVGPMRPVPTRHGAVRSRLYRPERQPRRTVVVLPGVHATGIDEPRMRALARELAATGVAVVTLELPDLMAYRFTPETVDQVEDAIAWLSADPETTADGEVGLMGISFAGGLALVAAGRPAVEGRVAYVFAFGGYGDLPRVLRYFCTGLEPPRPDDPPGTPPRYRPPHDYGVAVTLVSLADRMVPPEQVEPLRHGIVTFLRASQLDMIDKGAAAAMFADARAQMAQLPEPSATLLRLVNERNVKALGPRLLPVLESLEFPASLSPEASPPTRAPVFLMHGTEDNVIPAVETLHLAEYLGEQTRVRTLLTDLITHAEVERTPAPRDVLRLVGFWAEVLRQ